MPNPKLAQDDGDLGFVKPVNPVAQTESVKPTIEMFVTALQAGVNAWEAAGKILVALRREDDEIFKRIQKEHPFVTGDMLEVFWNFGMKTMYPMVALLPRAVFGHVRNMAYEFQVKVCSEPIQVVTRMVGDKPVIVRKPVSRLTADEAKRALWRKGNHTVEHQVKELSATPINTIQELLPKNKTIAPRTPKEVARFAVSRGTAGTWRFEKTTANPWNTQNVRLECGQCVIVLTEFASDQE